MKFKGFVIGLLAAILIVNIIGVALMVREEQEQSRIALAEFDCITQTAYEQAFNAMRNSGNDEIGYERSGELMNAIVKMRSEFGLD